MITTIICYLAWIVYALYEGQREAWYFHCKSVCLPSKIVGIPNEHRAFFFQRLLVSGVMTGYSLEVNKDIVGSILLLIALAGAFPFFHDGMYYVRRNLLNRDIYQEGWWSPASDSTTAKINLTGVERIGAFSLTLILLGAYVIIKYNIHEITRTS